MNEVEKKIIAIGGVGVTPESDKNLDLFILSQLKKTKNNIGFLATVSYTHLTLPTMLWV